MFSSTETRTYRFGVFELSLASHQILKNGREIHIQEQPLRLLVFLLERPGELLMREELREKLWPTETFVEFDDGLNTAIQKIRQVLGDDARNPRFVETAPRRGYRFIAPVEIKDAHAGSHTNGHDVAHLGGEPAAMAEGPARRGAPPYWMWIALASAVSGVAFGWFLPHGVSPLPATPLKLSITPPTGVEFRPGVRGGSAISPDGRTVAFVASQKGKTMLWVRSLDSLDARELPGTADALLPFWSPDSKSIGFVAGRRLRRVNLTGGAPQDLAGVSRPTRGSWSDDGTILFSPGGGGPMYRVRETGGTAVPATAAEGGNAYWPYAISGTDRFLYFNTSRGGVEIGSLSDIHQHEFLFASNSNAVYTPLQKGHSGYLLWMKGTTLLGQTFDEKRGKLLGEPLPVAEGVGFADVWRFADLSVSNNGVLLYGAGNSALRRLAWLKGDGSLLENVGEPGWLQSLRLSPDGRRAIIEQGITRALWTLNFETKVLTRLTFEQEMSGWPAWSPDGLQIAYSGERGGHLSLFRRDSAGVVPEQPLAASPFGLYMYDWSRDGRYLAYCESNPQTKIDVWILPMAGDRKPYPLLQTPFNEDSPQFSPDTRWITYVSDESGRNEVYVASFPESGGKWQISIAGGTLPRWSADGRELFFVAADGYLMSTPLKPGRHQFEWSASRRLFRIPIVGSNYDVAPRGDKFLTLTPMDEFKLNELTVLTNWQPAFRR